MNSRAVSVLLLPLGVLFATALTSGCSLKKQYPAKHSFLIETRRPGDRRVSTAAAVLQVRSLQVASPFDSKGFVYRNTGLGYQPDFYNEFLVTPRALLTQQVRQWLGVSGLFRFVLDPSSKAEQTHSLEGNVAALYGDFRDAASPKAVLEAEFFLINEQTASPQIAFHQSYRQEVTLENRAPETLARGWSQAAEKILAELEADLAKALQK
jgi:uncharacterized lipoprotein YmbA